MEFVQIRYAGDSNGTFGGGEIPAVYLRANSNANVLRDVFVSNVKSSGIYVSQGSPTIDRVHVQNAGAEVLFLDLPAAPVLRQLTGSGNQLERITLRDGTFPQANRVLDAGGDLPFHSLGNLFVAAGRSVQLVPGTIIKFTGGSLFEINGQLIAEGTVGQPIVFTSEHDDAAGGDSNGNSDDTLPQPGNWEALYLTGAGSSVKFVEVRYAGDSNGSFGGGHVPAIRVRADVSLENLTVRDSIQNGLLVNNNAVVSLTDSLFINNGGSAVDLTNGTTTIHDSGFFSGTSGILVGNAAVATVTGSAFENFSSNAAEHLGTDPLQADFRGNWWGDAGGPHDLSVLDGQVNDNPAGENVSDYLLYSPVSDSRPPLPVGPFVLGLSPTVSNTAVTEVDVTFTELIDIDTFTVEDIVVSGPVAISVTNVAHLQQSTYRLTLSAAISVAGDYLFTIGPNIASAASGIQIDQDRDGVEAENEDAFSQTVTLDLSGPSVISQTPAGTVTTAIRTIDVVFDEPMAGATFTPTDITLQTPQGEVQVLSVVQLNATTFRIGFPVQFINGQYGLEIGPEVEDLSGNVMDQDDDGTLGEIDGDSFVGEFTIDRIPLRITGQDPDGLKLGGVDAIDVTFTTPINSGTFGPADVIISGLASVTVLSVEKISETTYRINTSRITQEGDFTVRIGPEIADPGGILMDQDQDNQPGEVEDQYVGSFTVGGVGPQLIEFSPTGTLPGGLNSLVVTFSEAIRASTFSPIDFKLLGPQGGVGVIRVVPLSPVAFRVDFPQLLDDGDYSFSVGPVITDAAGVVDGPGCRQHQW